jgi:hypothetical protein
MTSAAVGQIRVRVAGARALTVDRDGALVARTGLGSVTFTAPIAYQERDGIRRPVSVAYRRQGLEYGFRVGAHDPELPLVIDPLLQSTYLGGSSPDGALSVAIHPTTGDVYVSGRTFSTDLPGTVGGAQPSMAGGLTDAFVARLTASLARVDPSAAIPTLSEVGWLVLVALLLGTGVLGLRRRPTR